MMIWSLDVQLSERRSETRLQNAFVRALDRLGTPDVGCVIKLSPVTVKSGLAQVVQLVRDKQRSIINAATTHYQTNNVKRAFIPSSKGPKL